MRISGCSSCEAVRPVRYQPGERTQSGEAREAVESSRGRRLGAQRAQAAQRTQAEAVEYQRSTSRAAEITVTTAEGDKVTLSLAAQSSQTQSAYRARGRDENGKLQNIRGESSTTQSSASVSVGIEGDLNEKELADIKKLIAAFGQLTQGDTSGVEKFSSLDTLSSAQFAYSATEQTGYAAVKLYA